MTEMRPRPDIHPVPPPFRVAHWVHFRFPPRDECVPALILRVHEDDGTYDIKAEVPPLEQQSVLLSANGDRTIETRGGMIALARVPHAPLDDLLTKGTLHDIWDC